MTVPVMIHLNGDTFVRLEAIARRKGIRMADMITAGIDRSIQTYPRPRPDQAPTRMTPAGIRRGHGRMTDEEWAELDLLRAHGYRVRNLATQFGISASAIYQHSNRARLAEETTR